MNQQVKKVTITKNEYYDENGSLYSKDVIKEIEYFESQQPSLTYYATDVPEDIEIDPLLNSARLYKR